jgi:hypothetical protein
MSKSDLDAILNANTSVKMSVVIPIYIAYLLGQWQFYIDFTFCVTIFISHLPSKAQHEVMRLSFQCFLTMLFISMPKEV